MTPRRLWTWGHSPGQGEAMHYSGDVHEPPTPEQLAQWQLRSLPPDNEVPGPLDWTALLGRTQDIAVALTAAAVYSTGLRLDVVVRARSLTSEPDLFHAVDGHGTGRDRLLLGVEFADGRVAATSGHLWPQQQLAEDAPSLQRLGSTGSDRSVDFAMFLHPLPPPGPLAVLCSWPGRGITETRTEFDATAVRAALTKVLVLWPLQPPDQRRPEPPDPPDVPDGGWFARVLNP